MHKSHKGIYWDGLLTAVTALRKIGALYCKKHKSNPYRLYATRSITAISEQNTEKTKDYSVFKLMLTGIDDSALVAQAEMRAEKKGSF